jgi:hypothetical protein
MEGKPMSATQFARDGRKLEARSWHRAIAANALAILRDKKPEAILRSAWPNDDRAMLLLKAAVHSTSTADYPVQNVFEAYRSLAPGSAAFQLFELGRKLDLTGRNTVSIPGLANPAPHEIFVTESGAIPVIQWNFASTTVGPTRKIAVIAAVTKELNNAVPETAATVIASVLADGLNASVDYYAFGQQPDNPATGVAKGLLNGVAPTPASTSTDVFQAMAEDLGNLAASIGAAGIDPNGIVYIAGPREATIIKTLAAASFDNPVLMTLGLPPKTIIAIAPNAVAYAYRGPPEIEIKDPSHSTLHYEGANPLALVDPSGTVAAPSMSNFQGDIVAIRVIGNCAWAVAPGGSAFISGVTWLAADQTKKGK